MIMTPATTATAAKRLVIVRHGESLWNRENRFTGWTDIKLTERGRIEAIEAARLLKQHGYRFDFACTSLLIRAVYSLWLLLDELDQSWLPEEKSWRLNERHYGALEGLNKAVTAGRSAPPRTRCPLPQAARRDPTAQRKPGGNRAACHRLLARGYRAPAAAR